MASSSHHHHHPHRSSSPGRRAIKNNNYGHHSDLGMNPSTRETYVPARGSGDRLAPPTQYVRDSRTDYYDRNDDRYHEPQQRSRRSTFSDTAPPILNIPRSTTSSARPNSPLPPTSNPKVVKKTYVIGDNKTTLVDNIDLNPRSSRESYSSTDRLERPSEPGHRRRASTERTNYIVTTGSRGEKIYHLVDSQHHSNRDSVIQSAYPESASSHHAEDPYTSEPRTRARRSSTAARERPKSFIFDSRSNHHERDPGPPSSRALDNYNEGILRASNPRLGPQTDSRRGYDQPPARILHDDYVASPLTQYRVDTAPPSASQEYDRARESPAVSYTLDRDLHNTSSLPRRRDNYERGSHDDIYDYDTRYREQREPRNPERTPKQRYHDVSVERRGFGLRPASREREEVRSPRVDTERRPSPPDAHTAKYEPRAKEERTRDKDPPRGSRNDLTEYDRDAPRHKDQSARQREYDREYDREYERNPYDRERERGREPRHDVKQEKGHHRATSELLSAAVVGGIGATGAAALAKESGRDASRRDRLRDSESSDSGDSRGDRASRRPRQRDSDVGARDPPRSEAPRPYPAHDLDVIGGSSGNASRTSAAPLSSTVPPKSKPETPAILDADEDYRRRLQQAQEVYRSPVEPTQSLRPAQDSVGRSLPVHSLDTRPRELERNSDMQHTDQNRSSVSERDPRRSPKAENERPPPSATRDSPTQRVGSSGSSEGTRDVAERKQVRIVEPSAESETRPKGILKRPKEQFPEHPNPVREGVAPLKDKLQLKGIPPGAKWTKVSRKIVNVQALEDAGERFEEREDHVIVLRVLDQEDIRKLAERTQLLRERRPRHRSEETSDREHRRQSRHGDDEGEYSDSSFDEFSEHRRPPRMLEAGQSAQPSSAPPTLKPSAPTPIAAGSNIPAQYSGGYPPPTPSQQQVPSGEDYRRDTRDRGAR